MAGETSVSSSRLVSGLRRRMLVRAHRGDAVHYPVCGADFDSFKDDWNRANALCWNCGSHERHRAQWLLFERRPQLLADAQSLLHFAPEWALRRRFPSITAAADREREFLQHDHVRLYAPDIEERLEQGGFEVEMIEPQREFGSETVARCRINDADYIWLCRPKSGD
ncbi:MAG TPA: hypothetical protein VGF93_13215 [Solirubrobacteraceae bacterium]